MVVGDNVLIREVEEEDLNDINRWFSAFDFNELSCFIIDSTGHGSVQTCGDDKFPDRLCFTVVENEDRKPVGECMLDGIDYVNKTCLCSVYIGDDEMRGRGYGSEAISLMLKFSFNELGLNRVGAWVPSYNNYAIKCFKKCGFKVEGIMREGLYKDGRYHDIYFMGILKSEYDDMTKEGSLKCSEENM